MLKNKYRPTGTGWYKYQNVSNADLMLPFVMKNGRSTLPRGAYIEGDSSLREISGLKAVENLSHYLNNSNVIKPKQENIQTEKKLLTEEPFGTITVTEDNTSDKRSSLIDVTKKELIEYAELKKVKFNPNWTKSKILESIRNHDE